MATMILNWFLSAPRAYQMESCHIARRLWRPK
jgi:hypothetical protein